MWISSLVLGIFCAKMSDRKRPPSSQSRSAWSDKESTPAAMENEDYDATIKPAASNKKGEKKAVAVKENTGCGAKFKKGIRCK